MNFKKLFTPKKMDVVWMIVLFITSVFLVSFYLTLFNALPLDEAFMAILEGTAFFFMSFIVMNSMIFPVAFFVIEFLFIRCADYFIANKKIKIPTLIVAVSLLYYFVINLFFV